MARLGIVGGAGWLGSAIAAAVIEAGIAEPQDVALSYRSRRPEGPPGVHWTSDNQELVDRSDVVILAVRPEDWPALAIRAQGRLAISVMAGVPLDEIEQRLGARVVRSLPNAAAELRRSYTPWFAGKEVTETDRVMVRAIFDACGTQDEVASEREVDFLSGLSGTGPAYPALLAAALMKAATDFGISETVAQRATEAVLVGAGRFAERDHASPRDTIQTFLDYKGVTAAGIEAMRSSGFDEAVARGLGKAFDRALAMGRSAG